MIDYPLKKLCQGFNSVKKKKKEFNSVSHSCFLTFWTTLSIINLNLFSLDRFKKQLSSSFNVHFFNYEWIRAHIDIFISHLYLFFCEYCCVFFLTYLEEVFFFFVFFWMLRSLSFVIQQMWAPPSPLFVIYKLQTFRLGSQLAYFIDEET